MASLTSRRQTRKSAILNVPVKSTLVYLEVLSSVCLPGNCLSAGLLKPFPNHVRVVLSQRLVQMHMLLLMVLSAGVETVQPGAGVLGL